MYKEESEWPSNECLPDVKLDEFWVKYNYVHVFDGTLVETVRVQIFKQSGLECLAVQYSNWLRLTCAVVWYLLCLYVIVVGNIKRNWIL